MSNRMRSFGAVALLATLAAFAVWRSHAGTRLDGFTVDEPWHIVAGVSYLRLDDYRLNPEHPPLVKLAAGAAMRDDFVLPDSMAPSSKREERELVERTMFESNDETAAQARSRIALWTFNGALLFAFGLLAWRALGLAWAAAALAFLALEPAIAAHLPVVMTDLPLALTLGCSVLCAGLLASTWRWRWAVALGIAVGLALGSKHSALAGLAGIAVALAIAAFAGRDAGGRRPIAARALKLGIAAALSLGVLWSLYGFRFHAAADGSDGFNQTIEAKVAELRVPAWRVAIATLDRFRIVPRSYAWGLADTVRAGVEGRGQMQHRVWGTVHTGAPPWFTWPSIVAGKLPLALLALAIAGALVLVVARAKLTAAQRWTLAATLGMGALHLIALAGSQGTYGGVRHALPIVVALALVAGAAAGLAYGASRRAALAGSVALLALAFGTTIREPRVWEFHNTLAGGTEGAWRMFGNEGVDLGQRSLEIHDFYLREIEAGGEELFLPYWMPEAQTRALLMRYRNRVVSLADENVEGRYAGWFVYPVAERNPNPSVGWDPAVAFADLEPVARFGNVEIWHGTQVMPKLRAAGMYWRVLDHVYRDRGTDWPLVARRAAEIVAALPFHVGAAIEAGNAHLRLGARDAAAASYRSVLDQDMMPVEPLVRRDLERQVARLVAGEPLAAIAPMSNPWSE